MYILYKFKLFLNLVKTHPNWCDKNVLHCLATFFLVLENNGLNLSTETFFHNNRSQQRKKYCRCHTETQSLFYTLYLLTDLIVIITNLIFLRTIWYKHYFHPHLMTGKLRHREFKQLKVTLIFIHSNEQWAWWLLETPVCSSPFTGDIVPWKYCLD